MVYSKGKDKVKNEVWCCFFDDHDFGDAPITVDGCLYEPKTTRVDFQKGFLVGWF